MSHISVTIVTDDGPRTFSTISDAAKSFGYRYHTFIGYIQGQQKKGLTLDEAATKYYKHHKKKQGPVIIHGTSYATVSAACEALKIWPDTIRRHRRRGLTPEQAFDTVLANKARLRHDIVIMTEDGPKKFQDIAQAARFLNRSYAYIAKYVKTHKGPNDTISDVLTDYYRSPNRRDNSLTVHGVRYRSIRNACGTLELDYNQAYRYTKKGMTPEQAIERCLSAPKTVTHTAIEPWSDDEIMQMRRYYPIFGSQVLIPRLKRSCNAIRGYAARVLNLKTNQPDDRYTKLPAYQTDKDFYYWFHCRANNVVMLLTADEIIDYLSHPSLQFCKEHTVPDFVHVPEKFIRTISSAQHTSYRAWLAARQEVTPTDV